MEMVASTAWPGLKSHLKHKVDTRLWGSRDCGIEMKESSPYCSECNKERCQSSWCKRGEKIKYLRCKVYLANFPFTFCRAPLFFSVVSGCQKMRVSDADLKVLHRGKDLSIKQLFYKFCESRLQSPCSSCSSIFLHSAMRILEMRTMSSRCCCLWSQQSAMPIGHSQSIFSRLNTYSFLPLVFKVHNCEDT